MTIEVSRQKLREGVNSIFEQFKSESLQVCGVNYDVHYVSFVPNADGNGYERRSDGQETVDTLDDVEGGVPGSISIAFNPSESSPESFLPSLDQETARRSARRQVNEFVKVNGFSNTGVLDVKISYGNPVMMVRTTREYAIEKQENQAS